MIFMASGIHNFQEHDYEHFNDIHDFQEVMIFIISFNPSNNNAIINK